jgi:hypothetical protein
VRVVNASFPKPNVHTPEPMNRDSLQLAFADLVSNGESSFLAAMDPTGEHALQKYSNVVQG